MAILAEATAHRLRCPTHAQPGVVWIGPNKWRSIEVDLSTDLSGPCYTSSSPRGKLMRLQVGGGWPLRCLLSLFIAMSCLLLGEDLQFEADRHQEGLL